MEYLHKPLDYLNPFTTMIFTDTLGGEVGLAISACMSLTGGLQYGMRQSAEVENQMTSVERVTEYGRLESEADLTKTVVQDLITEEKQSMQIIHFLTAFIKTLCKLN